jgi:LysM repeat protein
MTSRNAFSPILSAVVLSIAFGAQSSFGTAITADTPSGPIGTLTAPTPTYSAAPSSAGVITPAPAAKNIAPYTVVAGDTLTSLAKKFNTTRKKLKSLNNLAATKLMPGQTLLVPARQSKLAATTASAKAHHAFLVAQPVQDFDIPASTFASCPVPVPSEDDEVPPAVAPPKPIVVQPSPELAEEPAPQTAPIIRDNQFVANPGPTRSTPPPQISSTTANPFTDNTSVSTPPAARSSTVLAPFNPPNRRLTIRGINPGPNTNSNSLFGSAPTDDWGNKFIQQARLLGDQGIDYNDDWRPPGEAHSWAMDCSNTSRYLYRVTAGINLPRTASDQYYYLHLQGKAWDVPQNATGFADGDFLRRNLKPGDLLFWENTYRPERQPPITHVMVFLGTNDKGQWIMAGSQSSRGGEHNRRNGGPDIYVFRPSQPCGGYTTWLGLVHHQGRFCAFGRPLEADPSKLAED